MNRILAAKVMTLRSGNGKKGEYDATHDAGKTHADSFSWIINNISGQ
jgi:hypothetical protein